MIWYAKKILKGIEINIIPKTATKLRFQVHTTQLWMTDATIEKRNAT